MDNNITSVHIKKLTPFHISTNINKERKNVYSWKEINSFLLLFE